MTPNPSHAARVPALLLAGAMLATAAHAAEMTIYKQPNFTGGALTLRGNTTSLAGAGFQDQVSSIDVRSGRWQLCTQPDFKGDCFIIGEGSYPTLDQALNHRVESARELTRYADDSSPMRRRFWRNGTVELYEDPGFHGRALRVDEDADSLQASLGSGPSSLVIHEGRWQLCTRAGYEGNCRVFEPGRYADLGRFGNRATSIRRVG